MTENPNHQEKQPLLTKEDIAERLLSLGAISVETDRTYTWSSGIESPVYSDMRLIISDVESRKQIADLLAETVKKFGNIDGVAGTATAGIPHAALVAERLGFPMVYVRSEAKGHGKENQIEGVAQEGLSYVVIEDLISTGSSSIKSAEALIAAGAICNNVVSIFDYKLPIATENATQAELTFNSLTDFPTVMKTALEKGLWSTQQLEVAQEWYADPMSWHK